MNFKNSDSQMMSPTDTMLGIRIVEVMKKKSKYPKISSITNWDHVVMV